MPTTIKLKNSVTTTNAPSSLEQGEVAINVTDKKVWVGDAATTPVQIAGAGAGGGAAAGSDTQVQYNSSGALAGDADFTFNGTILTVPAIADAQGGSIAPISSVMRNRIINGAMVIDQRNAGASVTPTSFNYTVDRWFADVSVTSKFTVQQNAGSVTPPAGFTNYLGVTSTAATSVGAGDYYAIGQIIEGFNVADLDFGKSTAKTITASFWVRSSLTGTFGGVLRNGNGTLAYPFTYTISAANTWEQKTITVAGPTTGTWLITNGNGLGLQFGLGVGATFSATAGSWQSGNFLGATGATSVVGTSGATFYITGVQLEVGTQATSFEYRQYGTELALCQRYFEKSQQNAIGSSANIIYVSSVSDTGNNAVYSWKFSVEKRTTPTMTAYKGDGTSGSWEYLRSGATGSASVTFHQGMTSCANLYLNIGAAWTVCHIYGNLAANAEL
jgi:hypothetical protein